MLHALIAQTLPAAPSGAPSWVSEIAIYLSFAVAILALVRTTVIPELKQDIGSAKDLASSAKTTAAVAASTASAADVTANQAVSAAATAHSLAAANTASVAALTAQANAAGPAPIPTAVSTVAKVLLLLLLPALLVTSLGCSANATTAYRNRLELNGAIETATAARKAGLIPDEPYIVINAAEHAGATAVNDEDADVTKGGMVGAADFIGDSAAFATQAGTLAKNLINYVPPAKVAQATTAP